MQKVLPCLLIFSGLSYLSVAQTAPAPLEAVSDSSGTPLSLYHEATFLSPHLYNGARYHIYDSRSKDHQFFETEDWNLGSVYYDGQLFESIPMLFDIFKEKVIIRRPGRTGLVQLQSERIDRFSLLGHQFVKIKEDPTEGILLSTGFYDVLYNGRVQLLSRRVKTRQEQIENSKVNVFFTEKDAFYVKKEGRYHAVHSKKSALDLFEDKKKELKKHLRDRHIKFRKAREQALVAIVSYYDRLHQP